VIKCEYNNCNEKAFKKIGTTRLCKKHYLIVLDDLNLIRVGRPRKIKLEKIFRWFENGNKQVTTKEFMTNFLVTYPTAKFYLNLLQKYGFIKKQRSVWVVIK